MGGGGLPKLFDWNPESGEALPASSTFTRASVAFYRNDSGLWVEAASGELRYHNDTAGGGSKGYLPEPAATKLALFPRDFTNAAWVKVNGTAAKDATGIDGVANAASTLTATSANFTALQSFTRASSAHTFSVFVARKTGTGTIEITVDGGSTWVDITSSISTDIKDNPYIVTQTLANPSIGLRIITSGDEIEVDMGDLEATAFATTPLDHTSSTVTRVADTLNTGVATPAEHSGVFDVTVADKAGSSGDNQTTYIAYGVTSDSLFVNTLDTLRYFISGGVDITFFAGSSYEGERHKFAFSSELNNHILVDDEGNSGTDTSGAVGTGDIHIGYRPGGSSRFARAPMHNITIYSVTQTQEQLEDLVS
ncbi:MAG: phage head spike fiber domain-containing protein [Geminicoccaceae bacterium]